MMKRDNVKWEKGWSRLQAAAHEITFWDYNSTQRLEQAFISNLPPGKDSFQKGDIDVVYERRKAFIRLWHQNIPLFFCFIPLWLLLVYPVLRLQLSVLQLTVVLTTVVTTGFCYLVTFYRDGLNYKLMLLQAKETLLSGVGSRPSPVTATPKGCIPLLLLHELIQREAERPNIFNGTIDEAIPFYKALIGFNEKNFRKVYFQYRSRDEIRHHLDTGNARTTHEGYLDLLIEHYRAIGDPVLEQQAAKLQIFLKKEK